jgi:hypothetical protein
MLLALLISLQLLLHLCGGQECYNACALPVTTCTYVDYPVYPLGLNVTENEVQATAIISTIESYSFLISKECIDQVKIYTCGLLYPSCVNSTINETTTPTKIKPCLQMCLDVNSACGEYTKDITPAELQFINCSQQDPDGSPTFSNSSDCYSFSNLVPIARCFNGSNDGPGYKPTSGCQIYDPTLSPLTSSACSGFISTEIYVPFLTPNAQSLIDSAANTSGIWLIEKLYPVMPIECYKWAMSLLCQTAYPTCNRIVDTSTGYTIELGSVPCYGHCMSVIQVNSYGPTVPSTL